MGKWNTPRQNISDKCRLNHNLQNNNTDLPYKFTRLCVTRIIQTSEKMHIYNNKKQTPSICMQITQQPTIRYITHLVLHAVESQINVCCVMHCQKNTSLNLQNQTKSCLHTPVIVTILVRRCRVTYLMILYYSQHGLIPQTPAQFFHRSSHLEKKYLNTEIKICIKV